MATEAHKFQVGAFVITATVIGIGALIWLGASRFFEDTQHFVTYFSESVQGLDAGASVKYRGVPGGRVDSIGIAPDGELIEVRLNMDVEAAQALKRDPTLRATLELSGITGLRYIEIDRRTGDALEQVPVLTFKPPYEVIPSSRSSFKALQSALGDIYDKFMQFDLAGIASDTRTTLQGANQLLRDERIDAVLSNLKAVSQSTTQLTKNLEQMTAGVRLAPAVDSAGQAAQQAKLLFANLNQDTGKQLNEAIGQINRLALNAQAVVAGMQTTIDRLDRTVDGLQSVTEQLRAQPSLLLFSAPPAQRQPADGGHR